MLHTAPIDHADRLAGGAPAGESDERLVARVRAGSDAAFATIVIRYREPLLGFAARLLGGSHADAEDVVQDAFIRALRGLRASDRPMVLRPWLYMIVRNRAYDHIRAARPADGADRLQLVAAPEHSDPFESAAAREELDRVVAEIGRLPDRQRLALVQREMCGASHRELSDRLGTSIPATKSLLVRARTSLAEAVAA
ncbi:MAG TPA: sigma-70 family RNA polymerase sigma factor [Solirubrobacteraceae bacterium]|nr:sigma-70 family RNA polymerase sigma factor [Solirubrobacteraceae bacterium]